jgi:hypothetical protein
VYGDEGSVREPIREYHAGDEARVETRRRPAGVPGKLDGLDKGLMLLAEQVERAEHMLAPALRPERPHPVDGQIGTADSPDESDLAVRLDSMGSRATALGRRLGELLDRLDL